jgi:hypothetical protein
MAELFGRRRTVPLALITAVLAAAIIEVVSANKLGSALGMLGSVQAAVQALAPPDRR